jgi:hypothetical protein
LKNLLIPFSLGNALSQLLMEIALEAHSPKRFSISFVLEGEGADHNIDAGSRVSGSVWGDFFSFSFSGGN